MLIVSVAATRAADAEVPTTADFAAGNEQAPEAVKAGTATPIMGDHVRADNARADAMTTHSIVDFTGKVIESSDPQNPRYGRGRSKGRHVASRVSQLHQKEGLLTIEGFAGFREVIRRAVRQLAPNDVLEAVENHVRVHQELVLAAWDELRQRGAAVTHVTKSEYDRSCQLVSDVLQAKGKDIAAIWRDPHPVAKALIDLVAQEVKAYQGKTAR